MFAVVPLQPLIREVLPNADQAYIEPEKLVTYALDPENVVGRHKASVFRSALGIEKVDWEYLLESILNELPNHPVVSSRPPRREDEHYTWEVLVPITGMNGRQLLVVPAWEMIEDRPRLVTTRVARKGQQPSSGGSKL